MDFKSLISKLDGMEAPVATPSAPELPKAVQLNEDAELRVLAGTSTYIAEAKKKAEEKKEEKVDEEMKVGDKKASSTGGTIEKTKTGIKHTAGKNYGGDKAPKDDDEEPKGKKKAAKESVDPEAFKAKFSKMVEAAKPDFLDVDKDGDKKEPMKKAAAEKGSDKKDGKKGMSDKQAKYFGKKKDVKEAEEKRAPAKKSERQVELPSGAKVKATKVQGWQSQKADKEAKKEKNESVKSSKKVVAESVEQKLSFRDMMKLVVESGGQQQIDPIDQTLWNWANRVAGSKIQESQKAEIFAAMIYERNGGRFEMYDVLAEDKK
jgi:hypothetical protein